MKNDKVIVSDAVRQKVATLGDVGLQWLTHLGDLINELEQEWQLKVGASLHGGSEAYVAEVRMTDGSKAILKIGMPEMDGNTVFSNEITALTLANGRGYVKLRRVDAARRALLLEALGTPLINCGYPTHSQIELICATLRKSWVSVPPTTPLPTGADMARWFAKFIPNLWEQLNQPCSAYAVELALAYAEARAKAFDRETAVLVHGDAHNNNTLLDLAGNSQAQPAFKLIDPDGIIAEIAYDLGVLMREWLDELLPNPATLARKRCLWLSQLTGADSQAIWQWGFLQSLATGLLLLQVGQEQFGYNMLSVAETWARNPFQ